MNQKAESVSLHRSPRKSMNGGDGRAETEKGVVESLLEEARRVALAALYIGCGATVYVWEAFGKWSDIVYREIRPFWERKREERPNPQRRKVPVLPIDHYNRLNIGQILEQLAPLSKEELRLVRNYEKGHRNRDAVLKAVDRRLAESD